MSTIQRKLVYTAVHKAYTLIDYNIHTNIHKRYKFKKETYEPNMIIEWIPYNNLKNIIYLTKGGFSEIYTADWINGRYDEWDSESQQLKRVEEHGKRKLVLKKLENVESANKSWFEEV